MSQAPLLDHFVYTVHPTPEPLRSIYQALGVGVPVIAGSRPGIFATLRHDGRVIGTGRGLPAQRRGAAELARTGTGGR